MVSQTRQIAVVPGDGIGKEVIGQGLSLLEKLNTQKGLGLSFKVKDWGAERWLSEGVGLPKGTLEELSSDYSAIYFGALGDPRIPDMAHGKDILLGLRQGLDLYVNLRPIELLLPPLSPLLLKEGQHINCVIFRENTQDLYTSIGGNLAKGTPQEVSVDQSVHTYLGVKRIIQAAFEFAVQHDRKRVMLVDKSNAIGFGGSLWKRVFQEVAACFTQIQTDHLFVDVAAMQMVMQPERFDVVVTSNLFGDILSDLGAGLVGGLGLCASANLHPGKIGLFEPVHGSAPDIAGKGIANPLAAFLTAAMMMDFLGEYAISKAIRQAVQICLQEGPLTPDLGGRASTQDVGDFVLTSSIYYLQ